MTTYKITLTPEEGGSSYTVSVRAGRQTISFSFQWAVATQELYDKFIHYYEVKSKNDPLIGNGGEDRTYNWVEYYLNVYEWKRINNASTAQWIASQTILPRMIQSAQVGYPQEYLVDTRIAECLEMAPLLKQYLDTLRWQFTATCMGMQNTGFVVPGGWYREGEDVYHFRFTSPRETIGKDDLSLVSVEIEVYE